MLKRSLDALGALIGIALLALPMGVIAVAVRVSMGSPVLHRSIRPGLGGRPFVLYKFRTMRDDRDSRGRPLPDRDRMTGLGRFLRATSLDELPELLNVLKGDMSLVGPRPLLMEYLDRYTTQQARRHEVKPGMTGLAQVRGRNALDWNEKFALDVWYMDNWSLWLDLKVLGLTLLKVVQREGISAPGHATMPEFTGEETRDERAAHQRRQENDAPQGL